MIPTLAWTPDGVRFIDQTKLPLEESYVLATTYEQVAGAIVTMVVRGAPAIGVSAAYGSTTVTTERWAHTNVWAAGALMATYDPNGLHFYFNDPLGTRRAQTDSAGVLEQTCQSLPYGDGLACSGSITSPTEHHFTGKERDSESGNDYFGARYYASSMGRFMSPDWSVQAEPVPYAKLGDPQTLNLYAYVMNNPMTRLDADGHLGSTWDEFDLLQMGIDAQIRQAQAAAQKAQQLSFAALAANYPGHDTYPTDPNAANSIWTIIGGVVARNAWVLDKNGSRVLDENGNPIPSNTCAIRMSYDLNLSGLTIPKGKGTVSGKDGTQYFLKVANLQKFLTGALGQPQRLSGGSFSGPSGLSGIISFNIPFDNATGHFTLWNGSGVIDAHEDYEDWPKPTSTLFWGIQ